VSGYIPVPEVELFHGGMLHDLSPRALWTFETLNLWRVTQPKWLCMCIKRALALPV
jgi:hypothetical protein